MTLVVDANVVVKWFVMEDQHEEASRLIPFVGQLAAPDLILSETANILWKKSRRGEIVTEQATQAIDSLLVGLTLLDPSAVLVRQAMAYALMLDHPVYDCLYLACAEARGGPLITADERLNARVRGTPLEGLVANLADVDRVIATQMP